MEAKPAEIIRQARVKAENALMEIVADEITRICDAFSYDTGLEIGCVEVDFTTTSTIGSDRKNNILTNIRINHEKP